VFNDIIFISMAPHVSETRYSEVQEEFKRGLARQIQKDVRNRIDPGLTFRGHQKANAVKVELSDTGNITIQAQDIAEENLRTEEGEEKPGAPVMSRHDSVDDLFTQSSGVPEVVQDGGQTRVAFRVVRDTDLFGRAQEQQDSKIKGIVDFAVQSNTVDMMSEGVREVASRYPAEEIGSETIPGGEG